MRFLMIRHGEPDYALDCLTDTGKRQAAAAAERLAGEGISAIYASTNGRAMETAGFTAALLRLPVVPLEYMREITWGGEGIPDNGHPWTLADRMIDREGYDFYTSDWRKHPYFASNQALKLYDTIAGNIDTLLLKHGYRHEKGRFLCKTDRQETVALFSHGGSGACILSHLLSLPFPYVAAVLQFDFTSVTMLDFPVRPGQWVHPLMALFNDAAHIRAQERGPVLQQVSE